MAYIIVIIYQESVAGKFIQKIKELEEEFDQRIDAKKRMDEIQKFGYTEPKEAGGRYYSPTEIKVYIKEK